MKKYSVRFIGVLVLLVALLAATFWFWRQLPPHTDACLSTEHNIAICAASNMARYGKFDAVVPEHDHFNIGTLADGSDGVIKLHSAKNESVGFQLIFQSTAKNTDAQATLSLGDWHSSDNTIHTDIASQLFFAHYHLVDKGGYQWGPKSDVLPWPAEYPDALVPQHHGCLGENKTLFELVPLPKQKNENQAVWIDSFIPASVAAGVYQMQIDVQINQLIVPIKVELTVFDTALPQQPSYDAIGEIYRSYLLEGAGFDRSSSLWKNMARCYQQLAHEHRMVFMERWPEIPEGDALQDYIDTYQPAFDGTLFSAEYGYNGTGSDTPVTIWRTPWPQEYNVKLEAPLEPADLQRYASLSREWKALINQQGWDKTRFFAYVFDELDGPEKQKTDMQQRFNYIALVHKQMDLLQQALDEGSMDESFDLLWTSHSNPTIWQHDKQLDLTDKVRLWAPNASAADPSFLAERIDAGETAWFYHSGHPAVGVHSINASGIEMRTWGVVGARYGLNGQFMWAVNLGNNDKPFAEPTYKPDDDRFGNGVVVYPGNQLEKINFPASPGPLPSMRLKSWRRGLQDAEIFLLAHNKDAEKANQLIRTLIPKALAEGKGRASWSDDPADWIEFKIQLLKLASQ